MLRLAKGVRLQFERATQTHVILFPEGVVELNASAHFIVSKLPIRMDELHSTFNSVEIGGTSRTLDIFVHNALRERWMSLTTTSTTTKKKE